MKKNPKVLMIGTTEKSGGGITSVLKSIKSMPVWQEYNIRWLGAQIQHNVFCKFYYAIKSAILAPFIIWHYDIIHFHFVPGTGQLTLLPELLFAKIYLKKVIMQIHVGDQLERNAENRLFKWWLKKADLIVLLSERFRRLFMESFLDINSPVEVLYNVTESRHTIERTDKGKLIIMACRMDANKAPDLLINAWSQLKDKYPDWHVSIIGDGDVQYYKSLAERLHLNGSVDFPGYLTGPAKEQFFQQASIYCMCSYEEGFPMSVLEAWSNYEALITTPVGGLPDVITDGENCLVFPFGDIEILKECLVRLIEDEDLRWNISLKGQNLVSEYFSVKSANEKLEKIYNSLSE